MAAVLESAKGLVGEGTPLAPLAPALEMAIEAATNFDAWYEKSLGPAHHLTRDMPLMVPSVAAGIAMAYLAFVIFVPILFKVTGFSIKLKPIMRLYNLFMVLLSGYMGTKSILLARESNDTLFCVPMAEGEAGVEMAQLVWIFTFSKVIEFLDTVFMIMEGRMRQVSFLHVYHHVSILSYWFTISWVLPGSDAYFSLAGNSYIHVLMYGYYLLASFGYSPWWKYYVRPLLDSQSSQRSRGHFPLTPHGEGCMLSLTNQHTNLSSVSYQCSHFSPPADYEGSDFPVLLLLCTVHLRWLLEPGHVRFPANPIQDLALVHVLPHCPIYAFPGDKQGQGEVRQSWCEEDPVEVLGPEGIQFCTGPV